MDNSGTQSIVETLYDACGCSPLGKVKKVSQPYAPGGTIYWTEYTYDALGRTTSVKAADGQSTTTYLYQGNTTTVTDPAGKWKKSTTDAFGNLVQVTEPNPAGGANLETYYTYDLLNHLTQSSMTRASTTQTRTFTYDATTQRLTSETHPEKGTTSYTYNADGTLASKTDARNQKVTYTYDSYRRVTQINRYNSSGVEQVCQRAYFYYDTNPFDATFSQNAWGRLAAVAYFKAHSTCNGTGVEFTEMYSYTAAGRMTSKRLYSSDQSGWPNSHSRNAHPVMPAGWHIVCG